MTPQAVIFDIGNVLVEWQPERFYDAAIGPDRRHAMFAAVDLHAMNDRIDRGADFREVIYATADATPDFADDIRLWHDRWVELASPAIDHSVRLMRALKARGVPVFILSNIGTQTYRIAENAYPFLAEFDRHYISGAMGVIKPDADIYRLVEEDCGLPPEGLLFVDDRRDNTRAAAARGWHIHTFETAQGWAAELTQLGLLTESEAR